MRQELKCLNQAQQCVKIQRKLVVQLTSEINAARTFMPVRTQQSFILCRAVPTSTESTKNATDRTQPTPCGKMHATRYSDLVIDCQHESLRDALTVARFMHVTKIEEIGCMQNRVCKSRHLIGRSPFPCKLLAAM